MARQKKSKRVPLALALSLIAHGLLVLVLIFFLRPVVAPKKGVISVDFIESYRHDVTPPPSSSAPRFRPKMQNESTPPAVTPPEANASDQPAGDPSAQARETDAYIQEVLTIISRRKVYPRESLIREEEGRVVLGVSLDAGGKVIEVHVEESSRFARLDEAALNIITDIPAFPRLPAVVNAPLHLHIPIVYRMEVQR